MKWIIGFVSLVVLGAFVQWQRNSVKVTYVNGLSEYNQLPGNEYIFEHDCYVFKFKNNNSTWPLVGANVPGIQTSVTALPLSVAPDQIGKPFPDVRILDVIRSGSRFRIVSVRRDQSRKGTSITFEILLTDETERKYPRLDAYWILDHTPESRGLAPTVVETFAVPRIKK